VAVIETATVSWVLRPLLEHHPELFDVVEVPGALAESRRHWQNNK